MKIFLNEYEKKLIETATGITMTNYYDDDKEKKTISYEALWNVIEELIDIINHEKEEHEEEIERMNERFEGGTKWD